MKNFSNKEKNDMDDFIKWMAEYTDRLDFKIMHLKNLIDDKFFVLLYKEDTHEVLYNILLQVNDILDDNFKGELGNEDFKKKKRSK